MKRETVNSPAAPAALGPYVHAVKAGETLYISGQIGINPSMGGFANGIMGQAHQAMTNLGMILKSAGLSFKDVVKTTCFLADINDFATFNDVYAFYFDGLEPPARSCVQVAALPKGALIEIEAIAVFPDAE